MTTRNAHWLGVACLAVGLIAWMPSLWSQPGRAVSGLYLGFLAISLGWLLAPRFVAYAGRLLSVRGLFLTSGALALICLILVASLADAEQPEERGGKRYTGVRIFLLLTLDRQPSPHVGPICTHFGGRGWTPERSLEIPQGPCSSFRSAGGHRIALYESSRPQVLHHFEGRRDF